MRPALRQTRKKETNRRQEYSPQAICRKRLAHARRAFNCQGQPLQTSGLGTRADLLETTHHEEPTHQVCANIFCRRGFKKSPRITAYAGEPHAGHNHYQDRGHLEEKGKGSGQILQIGVGLGGKRLYHLTTSHFIPKYIRSDTKDTQQDPISTFHLTTTGEDLVNTSAESVNSGNRTDRGCANFFLFGGGVGWGRYSTGMREAFCESCSM